MTLAAVSVERYLLYGVASRLLRGTALLAAVPFGALFECARRAASGEALPAVGQLDGIVPILKRSGTPVRVSFGRESNTASRLAAAMAEGEA